MMRIYAFEGIDASLDLVPHAARRALDVAGVKVALTDWRATAIETRRALVAAGAESIVTPSRVRGMLDLGGVPYVEIVASSDPSEDGPPEDTRIVVEPAAWRALRPIDRYVLVKIARGKHPENLARAVAEIAPPLSTHLNMRGEAIMVDVGAKQVTARHAIAHAHVTMAAATVARLRAGDTPKGDVLATARIAGIQAAKRTPDLIPLCHAIALTRVTVDLVVVDDGVEIVTRAEARDRTGVEMEAMTAASVAALTLYDMLKGIDRAMVLRVALDEKAGGKTGTWQRS
jgi:cyclic pyranopterin phosphate synthase